MKNTSNPIFRNVEKANEVSGAKTATFTGVLAKTGILILVALVSAFFANSLIKSGDFQTVLTLVISGLFISIFAVLIATLIPRVVVPFSMLYALAEGFTLGTLTVLLEIAYPGQHIGLVAVVGTLTIFCVMLGLYSIKAVRATNRFKKVMYGILGGILVFSILSIFIPGLNSIFNSNPTVAIILSLFLIIYGAFMLVLDFDHATHLVESGASKKQEWTVSLGLMITIVWIYLEILRLAAILASLKE